MIKRGVLLALLVAIALQAAGARSKRARYIFVFPDGYVGWVQIIFNDPAAAALPIKDGGFIIDVPDSGLSRTSDLRVEDFKSQDEFYYHSSPTAETQELRKVPTENVLPGVSHGGFDVMDTGGRGKGYSWFVFVGPPSIRAKVPLADWDKEVEAWRKLHGNTRVSAPDPYPTPGRMSSAAATQQ
jgi:hypothetical protein